MAYPVCPNLSIKIKQNVDVFTRYFLSDSSCNKMDVQSGYDALSKALKLR